MISKNQAVFITALGGTGERHFAEGISENFCVSVGS